MAASPLDEEKEIARKRRTLYLLIGGAVSLLLPLMGVAYIKLSETAKSVPAAPGGTVFARRGPDGPQLKISPAATPATSAPMVQSLSPAPAASPAPQPRSAQTQPAGGSLGFIRGGSEYFHEKPVQPEIQKTAPPAPAPQEKPKPAPKAAKGPKPFARPKLKPTSGFADFKSKQGLRQAQGGEEAQTPDINVLIKAAGGQGEAGIPDVEGMLKNIPGGAAGAPAVGDLLKKIPSIPQDEQKK